MHMYKYNYMYVYICMNACMYVYICIYTYISEVHAAYRPTYFVYVFLY